MAGALLIYGATGYSGRLITRAALARGLRPIVCGRQAAAVAALASELGLEHRVARLTDPGGLRAALRGIAVVVHAAGPFSDTAQPMVEACLETRTHYLDIAGEIPVIESLAQRDADARNAGLMIMPGVGFDVVPSDCLAAHVARRLAGAQWLRIGLTGLRFASPGSARTLIEAIDYAVVRRDGRICSVPLGSLRHDFDYGDGPRASHNISWGDVATAYYTTGIPNIETYYETTPLAQAVVWGTRSFGWLLRTPPWQLWLKAQAGALLPSRPGAEDAEAAEMIIVAEATRGGRCARARLRTPEAYAFTGTAAAAVAHRAVRGDFEPGFQTPARVYGADFVCGWPGVTREDLD